MTPNKAYINKLIYSFVLSHFIINFTCLKLT